MLYRKLVEEHLQDPRTVLTDGVRSFTFLQLHAEVMKYCAYFQKRQLQRGDRILVTDQDPLETVLILLACIAGGYICVPISDQLDTESKGEIIRDCSPGLVLEGHPDAWADDPPPGQSRALLDADTRVYLIYTSGSEGVPKGVLACQKQIFFCCEAIQRRLMNGPDDRILCCLPISFDYGMYQVFLSFFSGAVLFLDKGSLIQRIPYLLEQWEITALPTIPTVANLLVKAHMLHGGAARRLRYITFTGEYLPAALIQALRNQLPSVRLIPMYGLTECKRVSIMPPDREDKLLAASCGLPLDGVTVKLYNEDPHTHIGELIVGGDNVMEGYWGCGAAASPVFWNDAKTGMRFVRTGDLFRIDQEGFLYFCGRQNGIIKVRGYRVSSHWLESRFQSIDGLLEIAAVGVPDAWSGERAILFAYTHSETAREHVRKRLQKLPSYLWNTEVVFTTAPLPTNRNGKLDRQQLRHCAEENA